MKRTNLPQRALMYVLSFQIALSPTLAFPQEKKEPKTIQEVAQDAGEFQKFIEQSHEVPAGQPRGSFAPDRFMVLEQEAHVASRVGAAFGVFSNAIERDIHVHQQRVHLLNVMRDQAVSFQSGEEIQNPCAAYENDPSLTPDAIRDGALMHMREGREKDTPHFIWDVKKDPGKLACVEDRLKWLLYDWNRQVEDLWETRASINDVPNVTMVDAQDTTGKKKDGKYHTSTIEKQRFYNWWDVQVDVLSKSGDEILESIKMKNTADHHSIDDTNSYNCKDGDSCKFELKSKGIKLNTFHVPVKAITTFGPYVVFVHNDSYDTESGIQYLSFVDLATYGSSLARADIPVFRVPIASEEAVTSLSVKNKKLVLNGDKRIIVEAFMAASELQQIAFNITSNLVELKDIAEILPYIDRLQAVFRRIVSAELEDSANEESSAKQATVLMGALGNDLKNQILQNKRLRDFIAGNRTVVNKEEAAQLAEDVRTLLENYGKGVAKSDELNKRMNATRNRLVHSRQLTGQVEAFFKKIMSPTPNASLKVKRALVTVGAYRDMGQGKWWNFLADRPWLHTSMLSAGLAAGFAPDAFFNVLDASLALGNGIFDYGKFALLGIGEAFVEGTKATLAPIISLGGVVVDQYIANGNYTKTAIGLGTFIPFILSIYYIPHLLFNAHNIWLDSKKPGYDRTTVVRPAHKWVEKLLGMSDSMLVRRFANRLLHKTENLLVHQREFDATHYRLLAEDEAKRRKLKEEKDQAVFTEEQNAEIQDWVRTRKAEVAADKAKPSFIGRFLNKFRAQKAELDTALEASPAVKDAAPANRERIRGFWSALASITFSFPAMKLTLTRWIRFWNWFAGVRYTTFGFLTLRDVGLKYNFPIFFRPKPISGTVRLLFPDFFTTMVAKRGPKVTIPTVLNGGTRMWEKRDMTWLKEALFGKPSETRQTEEDMARELSNSELKTLTETFEKDILAVEDEVHKEAFAAALRALPEFVADKEELVKIFTDKPLTSALEKRMRDLPSRIRTFIRLYYEEVYAATMSKYLADYIAKEDPEAANENVVEPSLAQLKQRLLDMRTEARSLKNFEFNPAEAVAIARTHGSDGEMFKRISKQAKWGEFSIENWLTNRKYNVMGDMDPEQNPSMKRFSVVQERLKSPNAVERTVRAEVSKLLTTLPADIIFKLVLTAGIVTGAAKPMGDSMWGENSIGYFSITAWYMMFASLFAMGMMADAWMKLQQDERQDKLGDFGAVPRGEDAEKSFFSWYRKQFNAKNNSVFANYANSAQIVFWNLPAALFNIGLFYTAFSGRLDLSLLIAGFAFTFLTPLNGISQKLDQAFERAVEYSARGIKDESWMAHPEVQAMVASEKQKYRNRFQLLFDAYGNVIGNLTQNIEFVKTSYGTRGFMRALYGGYLLEETLIDKVLKPAAAVTQNVPVLGAIVQQISDSCTSILSNGNTDLTRLRK